jgi:hypothetical protein
MFKRRTLKTALAAVISLVVLAAPVYANPGNGNGGGHGNGGGTTGTAAIMATAETITTRVMGSRLRIMATARTMGNQTMLTPISASRGRAPWQ